MTKEQALYVLNNSRDYTMAKVMKALKVVSNSTFNVPEINND